MLNERNLGEDSSIMVYKAERGATKFSTQFRWGEKSLDEFKGGGEKKYYFNSINRAKMMIMADITATLYNQAYKG